MNKRKIRKLKKRILHLPGGKYLVAYLINKIKGFYYKVSRSLRVAYPSTIMLELTNHCNLACRTCPREYDYGKAMDQGSMKVEKAQRIIDEVWPYLDSIGLTGMGETFLYKDLEVIVDYIRSKSKGIIISASTNANLPSFIPMVSKLIGKIDTLQISIDGLGEVYDHIRIGGSYQILDQNLRQLVKMTQNSETDLVLNMVVTQENYFQMPDLIKYAAEIKIKYMDFTLFNLASVTKIDTSYYQFYSSPAFLSTLKQVDETLLQYPEVLVTERNFKTDNGFQKCPFPWSHFYICWDGYMAPCCAKPFPKELHFGNVFDYRVITILNSANFRGFRRLWFANKSPKFCKKCHFIDIKPIVEKKN